MSLPMFKLASLDTPMRHAMYCSAKPSVRLALRDEFHLNVSHNCEPSNLRSTRQQRMADVGLDAASRVSG